MLKDGREKHLLVKKYLEQHSLVESNIRSFNDFIAHRMQNIVNEVNEGINKEDIEVVIGKIRIGKPDVIEADGSISHITPTEARIRSLTYSAPVFIELTVRYAEQADSGEVEIGRIPIMVRSAACNTHGMNKDELVTNFIDPMDPGGYFIVNGNERVMVMAEDLASNQPFLEEGRQGLMLRLFSQRGTYRIPTTITETADGIIDATFSRLKNIPAIVLLKALGMEREADIAKHIGKEDDSVIVNLYEFAAIQSQEDALLHIAEKSSIQGTKKEILDRTKQRIDNFLLPHIGLDKAAREEKALTLCKLIKQFMNAKANESLRTDKDHYANKRVKLTGDLLADLFRINLSILIRDIQYSLQKVMKRKKFYSIKTVAKSTLFTQRIESAIATGSWIGERTGVTQNMDKTNYLAILSQLQRVSSMLPGEQENFMARTLHPTHYGRFCPTETPEGTEIGLRKNLALLARVSTAVQFDEKRVLELFRAFGLNQNEGADVFFNGRFVGMTKNAGHFVNQVREARRQGEFPPELSIRTQSEAGNIVISTEIGRVLRPIVVVKNGASTLTNEHKLMLEQDKLSWTDLVREGIIEYLDAAEEEDALVALRPEDITDSHTHLEVDNIDLFGLITSLVPYANHDQSSRLIRGSKTLKQSLGIYAANYLARLDTDVSILHYPQNPLVKSFMYDTLNAYPSGQNVVVAILPYEGYNVEDAIVMNRGSVDRGLARSTYFRPYRATELQYTGGLKDEVIVPDKDIAGYRTEASYRFLEDDGIAYPEAAVSSGEVVIGKTTPPKFLSEAKDISIQSKKEASTVIRQEEKGVVDAVFVSVDGDGNKIAQVRVRDLRTPEPGDKFTTPHGQKGVISLLMDPRDVPFTSRGIRPDILFNPHGIPSRMTVGYLIELLAGKTAATTGSLIDGTAFTGTPVEQLEGALKELGFRYDGKETMYDGVTGKKMKIKIYVGVAYYLKLKYMVSNKIHARASGKVALLTRQPTEGRARGGALRLGEMEQQALVGHGAALLLKERYDSDKTTLYVATQSGYLAIRDRIRNKTYCPITGSTDVEPIEVSYAFKLLVDELLAMHILTSFDLKNKYE